MVTPEDDYPHPVPPQAFMTWKENWVFLPVDTEQRVASLFHFSPGRVLARGSSRQALDRRLGASLRRLLARARRPDRVRPRAEREVVVFEVLEPAERFWITYRGDELTPRSSTRRGSRRGTSTTTPRRRRVAARRPRPRRLPLPHYEQALRHEGTITLRAGPRAGETIRVSGYANRDHRGAGARTSPSATTTGRARRSRTATSRAQ